MNHAHRMKPGESKPLGGQLTPHPGQLSALLLRLYAATDSEDVPAFQDCAMAIVKEVIPFSGSWWGSGVGTASGHQVHGSHICNLPADLPQLHNATGPDNPMARVSAGHPNRAFLFAADMMYSEPAAAALSEYMGARESLCITQGDHTLSGPLRFLVITRGAGAHPFDDIEKQWLEWLNPHLNAALDLCCRVQMARWRRVHDHGVTLAISDEKGFLYLSEPGFGDLLLTEWTDFSGTQLPEILVESLVGRLRAFDGRHLTINFRWLGERVLLSLRPRHVFDDLSSQERAISLAFASGQSYKIVARKIGVAPATVRHHLRSAYKKLGISDKVALAQLAKSVLLSQEGNVD